MKTLKFYMYTSTADMILYIHVNAYCCTHSNPLILVIQPGVHVCIQKSKMMMFHIFHTHLVFSYFITMVVALVFLAALQILNHTFPLPLVLVI